MRDTILPATPSTPAPDPRSAPATRRTSWDTTLIVLTLVIAAGDLGVQAVIGPIPPLVVFALAGIVGVLVLLRRPRAGRILLLVVAVVGVLAGAPFALPGLSHPGSPVDFVHAVTSLPLRAVAAVAAGAALRGATGGATAVRRAALGGLAALVAVSGGMALVADGSVSPRDGDVVLEATDVTFVDGDDLTVGAGQRLVVDNADPIRHTFTVEDTDVDVDVPAGRAVVAPLDLAPGVYDYICAVPGHEAMTGTLTVTG